MEKEKKIFAILIGNACVIDTPFNEAVFFANDEQEARQKGADYIMAWKLYGETVRNVRRMSKDECEERKNNPKEYESGGWKKYRNQ